MYYCYILQSLLNNRYYAGSTDNIQARLECHNKGLVKSTKPYLPWKLVYYEYFTTRAEAIRRERQIKSWKKRIMIEKIISKNKIANPR
jgi:putative endonuclease